MDQVDVIIPTRNRGHLTRQAVESVRAQTHLRWRVLIVDDGSHEHTRAELRDLAAGDGRIEVITRDTSGGPQAARQSGYEHSTAPYVAILDSDDLWQPRKLAVQLDTFHQSPVEGLGAVLTWHAWADRHKVRSIRRPQVAGRASPLLTDNMSVPLFTRSALDEVGGFLPSWMHAPLLEGEHIEFWIRFTEHCPVTVAPELLVTCRAHSGERASDALGSALGAENLAYVTRIHEEWLARHPRDHALLLARVAARFLNAGEKRRGLEYLRRSLRIGSARANSLIVRRYGAFTIKELLRRT